MRESVFGAAYSDSYDSLYHDKDYSGECDLIESAWDRFATSPVTSVIDFGCGTGSHALELARRGYRVTGMDLSPGMLRGAQEKASKARSGGEKLDVEFSVGDVSHSRIPGEYSAAIMMFAVLGYQLTNERLAATLKNVRTHLTPGALFICDFWYGPAVLTERPGERIKILELDGKKILRTARTDLDTLLQTASVHFRLWTVTNDNLVSDNQEEHGMRFFFPQELAYFLSVAGFRTESLSAFPSLDRKLDDSTWNAVLVARAV